MANIGIEVEQITSYDRLEEALKSFHVPYLDNPGWADSLTGKRSIIYAARMGGAVVGYAQLSMVGIRPEREQLHQEVLEANYPDETRIIPAGYGWRTKEGSKRMGVGKAIGFAMEEPVAANPDVAPMITLSVNADNAAGLALYGSLGYQKLSVDGQEVFTMPVPLTLEGGVVEWEDKDLFFMAKDLSTLRQESVE